MALRQRPGGAIMKVGSLVRLSITRPKWEPSRMGVVIELNGWGLGWGLTEPGFSRVRVYWFNGVVQRLLVGDLEEVVA